MYDSVKGIALSVLRQYNVVIFAYGGTGSGKTYTMQGPQGEIGDSTFVPPPKDQGLCVYVAPFLLPYAFLDFNRAVAVSLANACERLPPRRFAAGAATVLEAARPSAPHTHPASTSSSSPPFFLLLPSYYRIITDLFAYFGKWSNRSFELKMSVADNYLNSVNDLLAPGKPNMAAVLMRGGDPFAHFASKTIAKPSDFVRYLGEATAQRVTGAAINDKSSRSHMAICLTLRTTVAGQAPKVSQLMMVDLAGSELFREVSERVQGRADKGEREAECLAINKVRAS